MTAVNKRKQGNEAVIRNDSIMEPSLDSVIAHGFIAAPRLTGYYMICGSMKRRTAHPQGNIKLTRSPKEQLKEMKAPGC